MFIIGHYKDLRDHQFSLNFDFNWQPKSKGETFWHIY